jgi:sulfur transfer complex TusBCD TusB component (DsrH family)
MHERMLSVWLVRHRFLPLADAYGMLRPMHIYGTRNRTTSFEVTDFLRANERMASLLPTALRMADLQRDVGQTLPALADNCDVLSFQDGVLTLAVPSSAVAARLKQSLPKLQSSLLARGWQITALKLKVQVTRAMPQQVATWVLELPPTAVDAFEELGDSLPDTPQNAALVAAIKRLAAKRRG